jgi:hypothetical protein
MQSVAIEPNLLTVSGLFTNMPNTKTERSNCRFMVQRSADGKAVVIVQLLHETIPALKSAVVGFDLLGGTRIEQAKKLADLLNEYVLDVFVEIGNRRC